MRSLKTNDLPNDAGWLLNDASVTSITKATAKVTGTGTSMPRRTVAWNLLELERKEIIARWETARSRTHPKGTHWRMPLFKEILTAWAANPQIATTGKGAFYVRGRGRRHMTPEEVSAWKPNHEVMAKNPAAHAPAADYDEPPTGSPQAPIAPPTTTTTSPPPPQSNVPLDLSELIEVLGEVSDRGSPKDAAWLWKAVIEESGKHEPPPVAEVAAMVRNMGRQFYRINARGLMDHGLIGKKIGSYVYTWHDRRRKAASAERENRILGLMRMLENLKIPASDCGMEDEQGQAIMRDWQTMIDQADPQELAEARNRIKR